MHLGDKHVCVQNFHAKPKIYPLVSPILDLDSSLKLRTLKSKLQNSIFYPMNKVR